MNLDDILDVFSDMSKFANGVSELSVKPMLKLSGIDLVGYGIINSEIEPVIGGFTLFHSGNRNPYITYDSLRI